MVDFLYILYRTADWRYVGNFGFAALVAMILLKLVSRNMESLSRWVLTHLTDSLKVLQEGQKEIQANSQAFLKELEEFRKEHQANSLVFLRELQEGRKEMVEGFKLLQTEHKEILERKWERTEG